VVRNYQTNAKKENRKDHYLVHWKCDGTRSWELVDNITQSAIDAYNDAVRSQIRRRRKQ